VISFEPAACGLSGYFAAFSGASVAGFDSVMSFHWFGLLSFEGFVLLFLLAGFAVLSL